MDVDLVVSRSCFSLCQPLFSFQIHTAYPPSLTKSCYTIMSNELQALRQNSNELFIDQACDSNRLEGSICGFDLIECTRLALFYEFLAGPGFGLDDFGD